MSDRAEELAMTYVRVLTNDEGTWGIDVHATWFPCEDNYDDVIAIASDIRQGYAAALRAYAEEARREEREVCAALADEAWETYSADPVWGAAMQAASSEIAAAIRARGEGER